MSSRIPQVPPVIAAIANNENQPLWSVMIPAYNCISFVRAALESVLAQDPGPAQMQIEVIDDCSTDGDVGALVRQIGKGRVCFYQQNENKGSLRNFETCLNRSRGKLVHLLHGDDCVKMGFYKEIESLFEENPEIGAAYTRSINIDPAGNELPFWHDGLPEQRGIKEGFLSEIASFQRLQPPSMVVKRSVYEHLGGFFAVKYGEDWEMWIRIAAHYKIAYSPKILALYRTGHLSNITNKSVSTGENIQDISKVINITQDYLPADKKKKLGDTARKNFSIHFAMAANRIYLTHKEIAFVQAAGALKLHKNIRTFYWILRLYALHTLNAVGINTRKDAS